MKILHILFILTFTCLLYAQENTPLFSVSLENNYLKVANNNSELIFEKYFQHPALFPADLDEDGIDEIFLVDTSFTNNRVEFTAYIYNTIDSVYLVDSIYSGIVEPIFSIPEELGQTVITTGNASFNIFNEVDEDVYIPLNIWRYESGELFLINDEIYDLFIEENETILEQLEGSKNNNDCGSSSEKKNIIAAAYANYISAGEEAVAEQFLQNYYFCDDLNEFKKQIDSLIPGTLNEDGME